MSSVNYGTAPKYAYTATASPELARSSEARRQRPDPAGSSRSPRQGADRRRSRARRQGVSRRRARVLNDHERAGDETPLLFRVIGKVVAGVWLPRGIRSRCPAPNHRVLRRPPKGVRCTGLQMPLNNTCAPRTALPPKPPPACTYLPIWAAAHRKGCDLNRRYALRHHAQNHAQNDVCPEEPAAPHRTTALGRRDAYAVMRQDGRAARGDPPVPAIHRSVRVRTDRGVAHIARSRH